MPEAEDWATIEAELRQKQEALAKVEEQITDAAKAYAAANEARLDKIRKIGDLKNERLALELKSRTRYRPSTVPIRPNSGPLPRIWNRRNATKPPPSATATMPAAN